MKCKFEHDGDCCNCGSPQYMCKCKPDVCGSAVPMTNADRIRAMPDEELARQFGAQCPKTSKRVCDKRCHLCWLEWLQQPSEDGVS